MTLTKDQTCCACKRNKIKEPDLKLYVWARESRVCESCAEEHLTADGYKEMTGLTSKKSRNQIKETK